MGLNFYVRCQKHMVVAQLIRGHEGQGMHEFYKEHGVCRNGNRYAVEVQADEQSEETWMSEPETVGYTDIGVYPTQPLNTKYIPPEERKPREKP